MSKYTTELRHILNSGYDLGLDDYPIFDEEYRDVLNTKIKNHYMFHEIGFETVDQFRFYLNVKMNEIMDYYNQLYKSELLELNPLLSFERVKTENMDKTKNENIDKTKSETSDNTATIDNQSSNITNSSENQANESTQSTDLETNRINNSTREQNEQNVNSDTPTNQLLQDDISNDVYASEVTVGDANEIMNDTENLNTDETVDKTDTIDKTSQSETNTTNNTQSETNVNKDVDENVTNDVTENYINTVTENGFEIPVSDLLLKYRETFLNIDMMIIKELRELFMLIY